jgi:DNA polymerase (family 10)
LIPLGSLRRKSATVGDIDIAVATNNPVMVIERFVNYPKTQKVIEKGSVTSSILLPGDVQVDILVMNLESYGNALQHFTGSKFHNIALREHSLKKGWSMNEHGIKNVKSGETIGIKTEKELYEFLDLKYIEPELREDMGEIEASKNNNLPNLVKLEDIKADLQIHSNFDIETSHDLGINSMEEIIENARKLNYEYIAFTEHNPSKKGHDEKQIEDILKRKREKVD